VGGGAPGPDVVLVAVGGTTLLAATAFAGYAARRPARRE
jgi:hypothetical protein